MSSDPRIDYIEQLKNEWKLEEALAKANELLAMNPSNKAVLYQIADIQYRNGEIDRAEKPVDFLLWSDEKDPMGLYIKGVLAMEKTDRKTAKKIFKQILRDLEQENPEILRCLGLSEYRSGNREMGIKHLEKALEVNQWDAEVIINLIEVMIMQEEFEEARSYITHYTTQEKLDFLDRDQKWYDDKIAMFTSYLETHLLPTDSDATIVE